MIIRTDVFIINKCIFFNHLVKVDVKTPAGKTKRGVKTNTIVQGDVFGPMLCGKQIYEITKECLEDKKYIYKYNGEVGIPPLGLDLYF